MSGRSLNVLPTGCTLTSDELAVQGARAAALRDDVQAVDRSGSSLTVTFGPYVDARLLDELVATERECCSFLAVDYDGQQRALIVQADDPSREPVLDALAGAFRTGGAR